MKNLNNEIANKIKQPSLCCVNCGKSYKKRDNLNKHNVICDLLQKSRQQYKQPNKIIEEDDDEPIPSQKKMFQMLIELGQKYNKLEEKVAEMQKWVVKNKKKINILDWLHANSKPTLVFEDFIDRIIICDDDVKCIIDNTFYDTLNQIFSRTLYNFTQFENTNTNTNTNTNLNPIVAFVHKPNTFYIYEKTSDTTGSTPVLRWNELSREKLTKFLNKIHIKIVRAFTNWKKNYIKENKKENTKEKKDMDSFETLCDKAIIKLMNIDFTQESIFSKVRNMIFQRMKTDMKSVLEYEFEV